MNFRLYLLLYFLAGIAVLGVALFESAPGYMDADYYYANGLRIANGEGWSEEFLWNYLSDPVGIPTPAYTYWMPLAAVLAGLGVRISGLVNFWGARLLFIPLAACIAPLTAYLSYTFLPQRWGAIFAGTLAIFSGFYLAYLPTTETFGLYMIAGSCLLILIRKLQLDWSKKGEKIVGEPEGERSHSTDRMRFISPFWVYPLLGVIAGLMYLTRADGILWLGICWLAIIFQGYLKSSHGAHNTIRHSAVLLAVAICTAGFLVITSPWVWRNLAQFGSVIAPGSGRAVWLIEYDDLFIYPATQLSFERWVDSGFIEIIKARGWALGLNLVSSFAVQGVILLSPLICAGMWVNRRDWRVILGVIAWLIILLVMTLVFPFQGARGGFFHAGAALQPLFWALVPVGLDSFTNWGEKHRRWDPRRASRIFSSGLIGILILVTLFITWQRINGRSDASPAWGEAEVVYPQVEELLAGFEISTDAIVMVNNPPGYYAMTGRSAIVIPDGDLDSSLKAGATYNASFLILDNNHPKGLKEQFEDPKDYPGMKYLNSLGKIRLYSLEK